MVVVGWSVVALMVLVGLGLLAWGARERRWWAGFRRREVRTTAVVTGASSHRGPGTGMHGEPTGTRWYRPHVRFDDVRGATVDARVRYPVRRRPRMHEAVEVAYDPERPRHVVLAGTRPPGAAATALVGGAVLVAAYLVQALVRTFA